MPNKNPHAFFAALMLSVSLWSLTMPAAHAELPNSPPPNTIQVSGTGKVSVAPDKADINLSVEVQAKTAAAAREQAASAMAALIQAVKKAGVADKDIQTRYVSLYPVYGPEGANKITGYQLANQVNVCVRDVNKASEIIDSAVKAGGNAVRVQGIGFAVDNPDAALVQAREKAYAAAREKAEQYAKLAGLRLGRALHINEGSGLPPRPMPYAEMSMMKAAGDSVTPVQIGEQEVSVSVDVVFGVE